VSVTLDRDKTFLAAFRGIGEIAAANAESVDRDARFPNEAVAALREAGALGALVPTELGGLGVSLDGVARACLELGRRCSSTAMVFAMHQIQVATMGRHLESGSWFESFLQQLAAEQWLVASVTSEIGTGGDMGASIAPRMTAGARWRSRRRP